MMRQRSPSPSMYGSPLKLLDIKWFSTAVNTWIQCTSGSLYTFSVYSQAIKTMQGYDQSTLDTVFVFKDLGANCGVLYGLLYSYSARHHRWHHEGFWMGGHSSDLSREPSGGISIVGRKGRLDSLCTRKRAAD
ncbi:hypothetical protein ACFX13_034536 [Malus domestica]